MKRFRTQPSRPRAIALFVVITSLMVIAFAMRELIIDTNTQVSRVRNSYDRAQAIYLARSTLNLAQFFIIFDAVIEDFSNSKTDGPSDLWANPIPFPIPIEVVNSFMAQANGEESSPELSIEQRDQVKRCDEFFNDFQGDALAQTTDLSSKLNLNDLNNELIYSAFLNLLRPNYEFVAALDQRGIQPEDVARQIRDYVDANNVEDETNVFETTAYDSQELDYGPKNREFSTQDELKMVPSVDSELYEYLTQYVVAVSFPKRKKPSRINLNTVSQEVFQALLQNVSNPEETAKEFIRDRDENDRLYSDEAIKESLEALGLNQENLPLQILTGRASEFLVKTTATVNDVRIELDAIVLKPEGRGQEKPLAQVRISP